MTMLAIMASLLVTHIAAFATAAFATPLSCELPSDSVTLKKHDSVYRGGWVGWPGGSLPVGIWSVPAAGRMDGQRVGRRGVGDHVVDLCLPQPLPPLDFTQPRLGKQLVLLTFIGFEAQNQPKNATGSR